MSDFVSADGSPLSLYLAIPAGETPKTIDDALPPRSSILELGSGPGRVTRVLVALGHRVVAVDDSEEMLEHVTGAEKVCADVFDLDIGRHFDCVLAGSHLINVADRERRRRLLEVCRSHVSPSGVVLIERYSAGWVPEAEAFESKMGMVDIAFAPVALNGETLTAEMTYRLGDREWVQRFDTVDIDDDILSTEAGQAGLVVDRVIDERGAWVLLRPSAS